MATVVFNGKAGAVAQKTTVQVTNYHVDGVYTITAGIAPNTEAITVNADTDENTTAANLAAAWNASAHPYCTAVTATVTTDTITLEADTPGPPFTVASSVAGGDATIGAATEVTVAESKHHFMLAENYEGGVVAANDDDIYIHPNSPNICWDLSTGLTGCSLFVYDTTARIGLPKLDFATSADGVTVSTTRKPEYREDYLKLEMIVAVIGIQDGPTVIASPSGRIKLHNTLTSAGRMYVKGVRGVSADTGLPTCRLMAAHADVDIQITSAIGGCGIGVESGETPVVGDIDVFATDSATRVFVGDGTDFTNYSQSGGNNVLGSGTNSVDSGTINGGVLVTRFSVTGWSFLVLTVNAGVVTLDSGGRGSAIVATLNGNGGTVIVRGGKTIQTLNPQPGFTLVDADGQLLITNTSEATGKHTIAWT